MKNIFTPVIISLCLLRVWSENPRNGPINLRSNQSRRQAEEKEEVKAAPSPAAPNPAAPSPAAPSPAAPSPAAPSPAAPSPAAPSPAAPSSAASVPPAPSPIQTGAPSASVVRQSSGASASTAYALPAGSEVIIGEIKTTFSCDGRIYGYYADIDNNCQVFHVCVPYQDLQNGLDEMIQYSFFCGNQTVFDQEALVCNYVDDAFPCSEAASLYDQVNQNFGDTDRPFRQKRASNKLMKNLDNN